MDFKLKYHDVKCAITVLCKRISFSLRNIHRSLKE